ncbi:hypothetical protein ACWKSP_26200 [Micromonosporaceae bacterium Da 78-11]
MTGFRDFLGVWLLYLIALPAFGMSLVVAFWIGVRFGVGRSDRWWHEYLAQVSDAHSETMPIPGQREASK